MKSLKLHSLRQSGFTLVELMVGLVVGLLVVLVATGSASFFEANRRSTIGGNNAQENAMAAAFYIQKDARMAGYGVLPECKQFNIYYDDRKDTSGAGAAFANNGVTISPVTITAGTSTTSDTLSFLYFATDNPFGTIMLAGGNPSDASVLDSVAPIPAGQVAVGDIGLLAPPAGTNGIPCTVLGVTGFASGDTKIQANPGSSAPGKWNVPGGGSFTYPTVDGTNKIAPQSRFLNIGQLVWNEYSVASNRLQLLNRSTNNANTNNGLPIELADNIVMMKAQYGVSAEFATWSTTPTMPVAKWINPSTYAASTNTNKDATIRAMRISVVARSAQKEKNADGSAATGTNCDATTAAPASGFSVRNGIDDTVTFNLSAETNWKCYRYRVVTLTIPLKNLLIQTFNTTTVGS